MSATRASATDAEDGIPPIYCSKSSLTLTNEFPLPNPPFFMFLSVCENKWLFVEFHGKDNGLIESNG
jgi:hypothetical protein